MDLSHYLKAGYPGIYVITNEPLRAIASAATQGFCSYVWDCMRGIIERDTLKLIEDAMDPLTALKWLTSKSDTVLFVQNFHHFISSVEVI